MKSTGSSIPQQAEDLLSLSPSPQEILGLVADRLQAVERMFREHLGSDLGVVREMGEFVAEGGGKRVRPTLHLLAARLCGYEGEHDVLLATVLEYIHSATLIHDDIIDEASVRRGRPSANRAWGNDLTVLFGDYLFAKAMDMALQAGSLEVMKTLSDVTLRMVEGEMLQTRSEGRLDLTEREHMEILGRKTAALFGACCELAGILAGRDGEYRHALRAYGERVGLAFQIVDDLLDLTGDPRRLGKPALSDLREGKLTLALIDLLERQGAPAKALVERLMESEGPPVDTDLQELRRRLESSGALVRARRRASELVHLACLELERFDASPAREALKSIPILLIRRNH